MYEIYVLIIFAYYYNYITNSQQRSVLLYLALVWCDMQRLRNSQIIITLFILGSMKAKALKIAENSHTYITSYKHTTLNK